jgi:hypothetical protein
LRRLAADDAAVHQIMSEELGRIRGSGIDKPVTHVSTHLFCVP